MNVADCNNLIAHYIAAEEQAYLNLITSRRNMVGNEVALATNAIHLEKHVYRCLWNLAKEVGYDLSMHQSPDAMDCFAPKEDKDVNFFRTQHEAAMHDFNVHEQRAAEGRSPFISREEGAEIRKAKK